MDLLQFGHAGARLVVFPSSMGRFFEWEDQGMIDVLRQPLEQGGLQVYCVDSVDDDSWYAKWKRPGDRAWRHVQYDGYVRDEVLPLTAHRDGNAFLMTAGASFGAYHAVTFALRYPHLVRRTIGLSGVYDIREMTDGYSDANVHAFNPAEFVLDGAEGDRAEALRRLEIILAIGRDDPMRGNNEYFSGRLWAAGIWHGLRIWDGWAHDWPYWRQMLATYVNGER